MIRQLYTKDLPELLRLWSENSTMQGRSIAPTQKQRLVNLVTNKLHYKLEQAPIFGEFTRDGLLLASVSFEYCLNPTDPPNTCVIGLNIATNLVKLDKHPGARFPASLVRVAKYGIYTMLYNGVENFYTWAPNNPNWTPSLTYFTEEYNNRWDIVEYIQPGNQSVVPWRQQYMRISEELQDEQVIKYSKITSEMKKAT